MYLLYDIRNQYKLQNVLVVFVFFSNIRTFFYESLTIELPAYGAAMPPMRAKKLHNPIPIFRTSVGNNSVE